MTQYPKLNFLDNVPSVVKFSYDNPKSGESEHGPWHLYGVKVNGIDMNFFATDFLHDLLQTIPVKQGMIASITKKQRPDDPEKKFWTVEIDGAIYSSDDLQRQNTPLRASKSEPVPVPTEKPTIDDYVNTLVTIYGKVQKHLEARKITPEPGDVEKLAVSIFIACNRDNLFIFKGDAKSHEDLPF